MRLLPLVALLVASLLPAPVLASGVHYRLDPVEPTRINTQFQQTCSFDVVPLAPGRYVSSENAIDLIQPIWSASSSRNAWLYAHRAGECRAVLGRVGYRYSWTMNFARNWSEVVAATGRASARVVGGRVQIEVFEPIWLSGEIAKVGFERAGK